MAEAGDGGAVRRRITVVGAGSGYMPGVIRGLIHRAADLAGSELVFHDLDAEHLALMTRLAERMFAAAGATFTVRAEPDLRAALVDTDYVFTTFRPGGLAARHLDESIPLRHGVVGQETAGPGGFLMACRSVPVLLRIAGHLAEVAPAAWIVNYTNPTNIVTDAVTRFSGARIVGLCDQHAGDQALWADLLDLPADRLEVDWIGLNHATWGERVRVGGVDVSADVRARLAELKAPAGADTATAQLVEIGSALGLLPNSYSRYYFFHDDVVAELRAKGTTRAEDLMAMMPRYYAGVAAEADRDAPDPSRERGGGEHGEFAVDVICALARDEGRRFIVNTRNRGAVAGLEDDAVVEVPSVVGGQGPTPLVMGPLPRQVRGLTAAVHEYEWMAAEAAATGDRRRALQALMAHPFVASKRTAEKILDEGLAAHRAHLPQFAYPAS
jgi:6-phospho-beta-glucosidase